MNLAKYIDHTILKADTIKEDVIKVCREAKEYSFCSVCVNPYYVPLVKEELKDSDVKITAVVGFPLGANPKEVKSFEAKKAIEKGAFEIDMVINISAIKNKDYEIVKEDIRSVVAAINNKAILKVIIETCLLTDSEKIKACELSKEAGADFVKTSTGFSTGGATSTDIKLMRKVVGQNFGVKASGGVKDREKALQMIEAGATRIGASSSVSIATNQKENNTDY